MRGFSIITVRIACFIGAVVGAGCISGCVTSLEVPPSATVAHPAEAVPFDPMAMAPDAVAIRVGGREITYGRIQSTMREYIEEVEELMTVEQSLDPMQTIFGMAIKDHVEKELIRIASADIELTDEEIARGEKLVYDRVSPGQDVERILAKNHISMDAVLEEYCWNVRAYKFADHLQAQLPEITEEEARAYYEQHPERFAKGWPHSFAEVKELILSRLRAKQRSRAFSEAIEKVRNSTTVDYLYPSEDRVDISGADR